MSSTRDHGWQSSRTNPAEPSGRMSRAPHGATAGPALLLCLALAALDAPLKLWAHDLSSPPEVEVEQGALRGEWVQGSAETDVHFAAFRGVPYAEPPVGPLRFKGPKPASKWGGVRDATVESNICAQRPLNSEEGVKGSEDCLYLNVYAPQLPAEGDNATFSPLTVLFYIHGGGFSRGSSGASDLGPELLVQHNILVVTINYRLGPLGFLNLDTEGIPGNAGLKDALAALRWVHRNIHRFGGDPSKITVTGHSAGAACAHYLTLVPGAAGLARAAILQSGNALGAWAYTEDNFEYATEMAARIAAARNTSSSTEPPGPGEVTASTVDPSTAEDILREASVDELLQEFVNMETMRQLQEALRIMVPSPERRANTTDGEEVLLTRDPESLILQRAVPAVPVLMGITSQEALSTFCKNNWDLFPEKMEVFNQELHLLLPLNLWPGRDTAALLGIPVPARELAHGLAPSLPTDIASVANRVKEAFFGGGNVTANSQQVVELLTDVMFNLGLHRLAILRAQAVANSTPTFLYRFDVEAEYNLYRARRRLDRPGAVHTDELGYLWRVEGLGQNYTGDGLAALTMQRLTTMWTNFVKTMEPVPETSALLSTQWPPTSSESLPDQTYLEIKKDIELRTGPLGGSRLVFWRNLFKELRGGKGM